MVAHSKTESWLTLTGQVAHCGADYSVSANLTIKKRTEIHDLRFLSLCLILFSYFVISANHHIT